MILPRRSATHDGRFELRLENGQLLEIRPLAIRELGALVRQLAEPTEAVEALSAGMSARTQSGDPAHAVLVAWSQSLPVGRVCIHWPGPLHQAVASAGVAAPEIHGLQVVPELRSLGIGTALLRCAEELILERGRDRAGLGVALENHQARKLYEALGYRAADVPSYVESYEHRISPTRPAMIRERREFFVKVFPGATLVLFDIDGTLLSSQGAGRAAMLSAGKSLFGEAFSFEGVDVNGRLDPLIWRDLALRNGVHPTPSQHDRFRSRYGEHLRDRVSQPGVVMTLPGVRSLLERLHATTGVTVGILSGNYPETGRMKLRAGGLAPEHFSVCAWGDDADDRSALVPVACRLYEQARSRPIPTSNVVVIGDTPHDVACALAHGCRALGVGTGSSSASELLASGAERAEDSLADVDSIFDWILSPSRPQPH